MARLLPILCVLFLGLVPVPGGPANAQDDETRGDPLAEPPEPVRMRVAIDYQPVFPHDTEPGDLVVYLDGDLLAWVPRGGQFALTPTVRFTRRVEPGRHVLRLLQENHEPRSRGRWNHEARVSRTAVLFLLGPTGDAELEIKVAEPKETFALKERGPVSILVRQDGKILQNLIETDQRLTEWPALCDEIEANLDPQRKVPKKIRAELEECLRWDFLWTDLEGGVATRDEARRILARYDYQPRSYKRFE